MADLKTIKIELQDEGETIPIEFSCSPSDSTVFKSNNDIELQIELENSRCINAKRLDYREKLKKHTALIIDLFMDIYNKKMLSNFESHESGIESNEENESESNDSTPYDPDSIRVTQGRFSLREIYEMIIGTDKDISTLDLSPDFQRNFVWDNLRKSRLIESILLKIPLPVFYLSRNEEGKYQVVDGVQRLSVIKQFFSNEFKLKNLEYLAKDCGDKYFSDSKLTSLHPKFVRRLKSYQVDCNIIEPDTPYKVKLDIFKRLNTGGRILNRQEIRNSLMKPAIRKFVNELSGSDAFKIATANSIRQKRMMDQELVLRYIGFSFVYNDYNDYNDYINEEISYSGIMDEFLDTIVEMLNINCEKKLLDRIKEIFYLSMNNATDIFGEYAFRKIEIDYKKARKNMINKSLFTAFSVILSRVPESIIIKNKNNIISNFAKYLKTDKYLYTSITQATNNKDRIDTTFLKIEEFLKEQLGGLDD